MVESLGQYITIKHNFFEKIKSKSKSGKTINLSVFYRGQPTRVFLWPVPIFRNQGSRWPILDADFLA